MEKIRTGRVLQRSLNNNITEIIKENGTTRFVYEYDSEGFPTSQTLIGKYSYEYEEYEYTYTFSFTYQNK